MLASTRAAGALLSVRHIVAWQSRTDGGPWKLQELWATSLHQEMNQHISDNTRELRLHPEPCIDVLSVKWMGLRLHFCLLNLTKMSLIRWKQWTYARKTVVGNADQAQLSCGSSYVPLSPTLPILSLLTHRSLAPLFHPHEYHRSCAFSESCFLSWILLSPVCIPAAQPQVPALQWRQGPTQRRLLMCSGKPAAWIHCFWALLISWEMVGSSVALGASWLRYWCQ